MEQNRQEVIFEVETTEQDYINDMVALQFFMKEISQAQLLSADDFKILFCNAPILCESNQKFLISLKSKRQESRMVSTVGDSFLILVTFPFIHFILLCYIISEINQSKTLNL